MKPSLTLKMPAILENIPKAMDCVARSARAAGMDEQTTHQIQLAVDEACANVVAHAYAGMQAGQMEISCTLEDQAFVVRVRDWGQSLDPDAIDDPDIDAPLEERSLGGLGLYLIRQYMDQVEFDFDPETGNELKMTKRL
jgi:anti-sigma regulatory factor (Ser/Thr protein kinase)